jgi:hypothetical protein
MRAVRRGRRMTLASLVSVAGTLLIPGAASATITIGSNLARTPDTTLGCNPSCTRASATLSPGAVATGGLVSTVNGTVVTWRIRIADNTAPTALRVITRSADGFAIGAATSATVTPALGGTSTFPTQLPITTGQVIGVDCCIGGEEFGVSGSGNGTTDTWLPALADGGAPQDTFMNGPPAPYELAINADIEPTATLSSVKAKPKKGGKIKVKMVAPNPGTLFATGKGLHSTPRKQVPAAGPFTLVVKPYFRTKRKLADGKTVKAKLKLTFTPTGGSAAVQALKVKLKR